MERKALNFRTLYRLSLVALAANMAGCSDASTSSRDLADTAGSMNAPDGSGGTSSNDSGQLGVGTGGAMTATGGVAANPSGGEAANSGAGTGAMAGSGGASGGTGGGGTSNANGPAGLDRVDNPYMGVVGYVNPEWKMNAEAESGGDRVSNTPTAVWLDRIAAIEGTPNSQSNGAMGLRDHLDAALDQGAGYAQFVIYDLPGRDCSALASNGELGPDDLPRYKSEYIDPIAAIMGDAKYSNLRIITIIEPDSLPNLVTNTNVTLCAQMQSNGGYVQGVVYALQQLGALSNVYNYVDAGHHGWLGWDTNLGPTADLFAQVRDMAGADTIAGFITNTANYSALVEPFFDANTTVNGTTVRQSTWVDWNFYVDELSFAQAFRDQLISVGFDTAIGMLIDTSRNGWGGVARPTAVSTSTDVNTFVDESRVDRRIHAGNWCNQSGAGLGERPTAAPESGIDAYVWIKPPGESDGSSMEIANSDGKGFDPMCDPTYSGNERNGNSMTGALSNAPISGAWFSAQFQELMQNANPPL